MIFRHGLKMGECDANGGVWHKRDICVLLLFGIWGNASRSFYVSGVYLFGIWRILVWYLGKAGRSFYASCAYLFKRHKWSEHYGHYCSAYVLIDNVDCHAMFVWNNLTSISRMVLARPTLTDTLMVYQSYSIAIRARTSQYVHNGLLRRGISQ